MRGFYQYLLNHFTRTARTFARLFWLTIFCITLTTAASAIDVLVVAADNSSGLDVQNKLFATGLFTSVTTFDATASTPTIDFLESFDCVFAYSNSPWFDTNAAGNVLADYVDRGGGLVTALPAHDNTGGWFLQGRFNTDNYWAIQPGLSSFAGATLGNILQPGHPALFGVSSLSVGAFRTANTLHPDAVSLADWNATNIPIIAARTIRGVRRIDLGFFPVSSDVSGLGWSTATDGDLFMANALLWVCPIDETGPRIAIMGAPGNPQWNFDVRAKLLSQRVFSGVDVFDLNFVTPSVATMQQYCSILVFTDGPPLAPDVLGNNLATYIDSGGGVVTSIFAFDPQYSITGRFHSQNYWVIQPTGTSTTGVATIGPVASPASPLMTGVLTYNGGASSYRPQNNLHPLASPVAFYNTGETLIASRNINGVRRVDLGFYPPSSDARSDFWDVTTDGARIMANALLYTCPSSKPSIAIFDGSQGFSPNFGRDIDGKLERSRKFSHIDVYDISAGPIPAYSTMQPYAGIFVWTDSFATDFVTLGNQLADYIDAGGGVVLGTFSQNAPTTQIQGRFAADNYWAILPAPFTTGAASLGAVSVPTHPIMSGVFAFNGGSSSYRTSSVIHPLSQLIASWNDGLPLIATRVINNVRRVDLNFFAASSDARSDLWDRNTNGDEILANALSWVVTRYRDDFSDLEADDWLHKKGTWSAVTGALNGLHNRKADNLAPFTCGANCSIGADIRINSVGARGSLLGWFFDKKNFVEVRLFEDRNKVLLLQKSGGIKAAKGKFLTPINPLTTYQVRVDYDGALFSVYLNGTLILVVPSGAPALGTTGVRLKSTTGANASVDFDRIIVY